ncbi:MAG: hypothetical protein LBK95_05060 [Bifidobacteriaceae bacterium]|nr:hypothetical protein [Bifidobacteriaceae bacterium]
MPTNAIAVDPAIARSRITALGDHVETVRQIRQSHLGSAQGNWGRVFGGSSTTAPARAAANAAFSKINEVLSQCVRDMLKLADFYAGFVESLTAEEQAIIDDLRRYGQELEQTEGPVTAAPDAEAPMQRDEFTAGAPRQTA